MDNFEYYITSIEELLSRHPEGMTVSEIAQGLKVSRNTVGKYLEIMCLSGAADVRSAGKAKIYFLAPRIPVTRILNYLQDAVIQTDHRYRIVHANLAALELLCSDENEVPGRNVLDLLCLQGMPADIRGRITDTDRDSAITLMVTLDCAGKQRMYWMTVVELMMYNGIPGQILFFTDISDWNEAEMRRREYEFLFSALCEETYEMVFLCSPEFEIRYANGPCMALFREHGDSGPGSSLLGSFDKKNSQIIRDAFEYVLDQHEPKRFIFPLTETGTTRWLDTRLFPVPARSGEMDGILGVIRDITGFQEGGGASALLASLLETMVEGVLTVTAGGTILTWNRGAEMITGYPAEELLGGMGQIIIPPELNAGQDVITLTVQGQVIRDLKMIIRAKGGRKKKVIMSTSIVRDHVGAISQVVLVWREP